MNVFNRNMAQYKCCGSSSSSFGARPLLAEIFWPPCRLCGPCPLLQAADEASSASSSEGLHSLDRLSGLTCSLEFRFQGVVRGVVLSFSPSRREAFCCSSPFVGHHHGRVRSGVGGSSSPSPCVRGLVEGGGLWSYQYSGIEGSSSSSTEPRISCGGSFASDLFKLHDGGIVHHFSGRNSFLIPVSADLGPVGMVSSEENFSSRGSHSRRRVLCGGFSLQGLIPSYSVSSESCRFSVDLSYVFFPFGVSFVRVSFQFPAPEVLLSVPGCSGVEYRRSVVSLVGFSTLRVFPFSLLLRILDKLAQDEADLLLVASFGLRGLGFLVSWGSWWAFRGCCQSWKTWWYNPCLCFRISRLKVFIFLYGLSQATRWEGRLFTESCAVRSWGL